MDIAEVLKIADDLMFGLTSKYLDNLQRSIVQGVWEGKTYKDIADHTDRSEGYIRDSAANLWQNISEAVGENVRKSNFKSVVERNQFSIVSSHHIRVGDIDRSHKDSLTLGRNEIGVKKDVGDNIPDLFPFYGRDLELDKLKQWIIEDKCRLIDIFGMSGIGKTALISQLATQIRDEFECGIWQNLRSKRSLVDLIDRDLLPFLPIEIVVGSQSYPAAQISLLIEQLSKHRCLIILDDIHHIFSNCSLAGTYEDHYQNYQDLFRRISESNHQSCLVLIGWEQPREFALSRSIHTLTLNRLDPVCQQQILKDRGVINGNACQKEIDYYNGNPLWLNIIATTIKDLLGGRINDFCQDRQLFLTNDLKLIFQTQYNRLSAIEQQVLQVIATQDRSMSVSDLIISSQILPNNLIEALQSLGRRGLIDKQETEGGVLLDLQPILKEFILLLVNA